MAPFDGFTSSMFPHSVEVDMMIKEIAERGELHTEDYNTPQFVAIVGMAAEFDAMIPILLAGGELGDKMLTLVTAAFVLGAQVGKKRGKGLVLMVAPEMGANVSKN